VSGKDGWVSQRASMAATFDARHGVLENLSKPYIQRKFRRLAGIGRLGTRRPLKRPSLIAGSAAAQEALERLVARGPPGGSGISAEAWRSWHRSGFIVCPASKRPHACSNHRCRMGADCRELRALGLRGNRSPLPRKERPVCGARNRRGNPCGVGVEPRIAKGLGNEGQRVAPPARKTWPGDPRHAAALSGTAGARRRNSGIGPGSPGVLLSAIRKTP
jgi:hypothetical protein